MFSTNIKRNKNKTMLNANMLLEPETHVADHQGYLEALGPDQLPEGAADLGHVAGLDIQVEQPDEGVAENIPVTASRGEGGEESQEGQEQDSDESDSGANNPFEEPEDQDEQT